MVVMFHSPEHDPWAATAPDRGPGAIHGKNYRADDRGSCPVGERFQGPFQNLEVRNGY